MEHQLPKPLIITISIIQGILLTLLYRSLDSNTWPSTEPLWLVSLTTFVISFPLLIFFSITKKNIKSTIIFILPYCLLLAGLGAYVGFQQEPTEYVNNTFAIVIFSLTALIASFKVLIYIQQYSDGKDISYSSLFKLSWRNFIIFAECWLFILILWGILILGASLFTMLEINFFKKLLEKEWIIIPILTLAFAFALIIFRSIVDTLDTIATILQTLIKFLLPALTVVSLGFIATLPFTGLDKLWHTGSGSLLVLWLQALMLFFVNAVYQQASHQRPYHPFFHKMIFFGVALLPVYSVISMYGLWLRIAQYGLTVGRCWAILVCFLLACFSLGYLIGILRKRAAWLETLSKVNIMMGVVVLVFMLLINSPILNFQRISAVSQIARLSHGDVNVDNFDYEYFGHNLGRQGYLELQNLKAQWQNTYPDKVVIINRMYTNIQYKALVAISQNEFEQLITFWPNKADIPLSLVEFIYKKETGNKWSRYRKNNYYFIAVDMNKDGNDEYVVITENNNYTTAKLWRLNNKKWFSSYMNSENPHKNKYLKGSLMNNKVEVNEPEWQTLQIGELSFKVAK